MPATSFPELAIPGRTGVADLGHGPALGGPVAASAAPVTEAAFGRKREAAIANAVASSQAKRTCVAPDMNWVQRADDPEMTPAPMCVEDVAKRVKQQAGKTTASVVATRETHVVRSSIPVSLKSGAKQRPAGILLVLPTEENNSQGSSAWV